MCPSPEKPTAYAETTLKRPPRETFAEKIFRPFSYVTVEPMVMCYMLSMIVTTLTTQNLNLEKACRVNLAMNETVCDAIKSRDYSRYSKSDEVEVQKVVASAYIWKFALQSAFVVVILAFVGSWSDRNSRRKPCLITPLLGEIATSTCLILCTYFFYELPLEVNILSELLSCMATGGINVFMVGVFTLICSKTTVEGRTVRVGVIHVLVQLGATVGLAVSGVLLQTVGFFGVYTAMLFLHSFSLLYGIFFIKEEPGEVDSKKRVGFVRDFFNVESLKGAFEVVFRNKDRARQRRIHMIMIIAMLVVGPMHGELGVLYLYTRYKFEWNEVDFGMFFSCCAIIHLAAATVSLCLFSKWLKLDDSLIGCIAACSKIAGSLVYAFAPNGRVFYIGIAADVLSSVLFITMRSIVTKQVGAAELGKMNAIFGLAEALVPFVYGPLYSATYRWTISAFPGTFYVISAVMTLPVWGLYLWMYLHKLPNIVDEPESLEGCKKPLVK